MIKTTRCCGKIMALAAMGCAMGATGFADIVYDNSSASAYQGQWFNAGTEFGDQVNLAGTARVMTDLKIDYFLSSNASGNETAELRVYANDGTSQGVANGTPFSLLYDSGTVQLAKGFNTIKVSGLSTLVPDTFTWTVIFNGVDPIETAGVLAYNPPTVGSSFNDFWAKSASGAWALNTFSGSGAMVANFGAQVTAIPEPGTVALAMVGGLVWLGVAARRRRA